uniref:Protein kinase domain-containing protein n=3 Tax=Triticinae TaxID=1648030 RepID=A0A453R0M1_AEGTS
DRPMHIPAAAAVLCSATLLLTAVLATHAQNTTMTTLPSSSTSCDPAMCGGLRIKYPFWLGGTHPPVCGYRAFQVTCDRNGTASLRNSIWTYQITEISYGNDSGTFRVANTDLSDGSCDIILKVNASSDLGYAPFGISGTNQKLFFLYNCTDLEAQPLPLAWAPVNCTNANASIFNSFALLAGGDKPDNKWEPIPGSCTVSMMPVLGYPGATGADYRRLMNSGFLVEYTADDCRACEESGGFCRINTTYDIFECRCSDGMSDSIICHSSGSERRGKKIMLIGTTSAAASFLCACLYVLIWHRKGKRLWFLLCKKASSNTEKNYEAMIVSYGSLAPKRYMYSEVMKITSYHNDQLGKGGYGVVFKGRLHDDRLVAVKCLHDCKGNGDEFVNEVMSIGRTSHVNVVSLFGFCLEGSKRALIYEYMPNGSLDRYIYSENPKEILGWERLYTIAIGIARGLEYLHHSCNTRIIHFDIKPQNILLDKDFSPKIADFGLAKLCHTMESKLSMTGARGTIGFIAPEVHSRTFGVVSTKSDVYSYGMMLLEMVGGRRNVKSIVAKSSEEYFPDWIYDHFAQDDGLQACEVIGEIEEIAKKMTLIGLWCVQILPAYRPTITKVLEMFERSSDDMDMPPKQNFSGLPESSAHNMDVQSSSSTRSEEISLVN